MENPDKLFKCGLSGFLGPGVKFSKTYVPSQSVEYSSYYSRTFVLVFQIHIEILSGSCTTSQFSIWTRNTRVQKPKLKKKSVSSLSDDGGGHSSRMLVCMSFWHQSLLTIASTQDESVLKKSIHSRSESVTFYSFFLFFVFSSGTMFRKNPLPNYSSFSIAPIVILFYSHNLFTRSS